MANATDGRPVTAEMFGGRGALSRWPAFFEGLSVDEPVRVKVPRGSTATSWRIALLKAAKRHGSPVSTRIIDGELWVCRLSGAA